MSLALKIILAIIGLVLLLAGAVLAALVIVALTAFIDETNNENQNS